MSSAARMSAGWAEALLAEKRSVWLDLAELGLLVMRLLVAVGMSAPSWVMDLLRGRGLVAEFD